MADDVHLIPIDAIDEAALLRDRTGLDPEELAELRGSIAAVGLRMPVEVFALAEPREGRTHGLISGFRRLAAVRALHAETGEERWARVAAFLRAPADTAAALAAMVEENEIREEVSAWERGATIVAAVRRRIFPTIDAAVEGLHPAAGPQKVTRLRALARAVEALDGAFTEPELLSQAQVLRLAAACRAGFADDIHTSLAETEVRDTAFEWEKVLPLVVEAELAQAGPGDDGPRVLRLRRELTVRRQRTEDGWLLRFTGREANFVVLEGVFLEVETLLGART